MAEYRHVYHIDGLTDRAVQKAGAERRDGPFILHEHKQGALCNEECKAYWPGETTKGDMK